jgi:hypothetical protein
MNTSKVDIFILLATVTASTMHPEIRSKYSNPEFNMYSRPGFRMPETCSRKRVFSERKPTTRQMTGSRYKDIRRKRFNLFFLRRTSPKHSRETELRIPPAEDKMVKMCWYPVPWARKVKKSSPSEMIAKT